jgi:hypothetical protein
MEKVFKTISNSLLTMFLFGLMLIPIASMTMMGVKPQNKDVLSAQDEAVTPKLKETPESTSPGEPNLPDLPGSANPEEINN